MGQKELSSHCVALNSLSSFIVMHVDFRQTCLCMLVEELEIGLHEVVRTQHVQNWFHNHLKNVDTSSAAIECCVQLEGIMQG